MKQINEARLESDLGYRFAYLAEFVGFGEDDIQAIHAAAGHLAPLVSTLVDAVYDKLFGYSSTKRHFVPRQYGYEGPVPESLETLPMDALDGRNPLENRLRFKDFQICDCRGTAQRISGIRMSVEEGPGTILTEERIVDFLATDSRCQRQETSSQPLR